MNTRTVRFARICRSNIDVDLSEEGKKIQRDNSG
jgi:hypothetical protein